MIVVPRAKGLLESPQRLPPHPFTAGGRRDFGALPQAKPDVFPGRLLIFVRAATRVSNKVKGLNRVVYDVTSKPPGTIERECGAQRCTRLSFGGRKRASSQVQRKAATTVSMGRNRILLSAGYSMNSAQLR
jgi:hypothetical protein